MTQTLVISLARIVEKPNTSKRDSLTITRRVLRHVCKDRRAIHDECHALRRKARKLKQFLPFTAQAVADLELQASEHGGEVLESLRNVLAAYGQTIIHDGDGISDALGFDALCDHLSINTVHREQARRDGGATLQGLAFIARMEDSTTAYGDEWGAGGPLFEACMVAMCGFIQTCPEHLLPDPFAPDGPFYGATPTLHHPDGTTSIKRPDVTVHDSSGSRVIKR
ncbi:MAG: hypothetical protein Q8R10_05885 [Pseudomonas sp.]|uniref:hypothetical protein n=1 Tax=Pseudomonas sp. TaxID=306 RepID=UPI002732DE81|nr:hypothetical protein [Pseudomonas sp.]MDP3845940.1 hypothetical protein [Pseudomonas sp.]